LLLSGGVLELGAEPADDAAAFFFGPFVVERDEAGEDFLVREVFRPAVGVGDVSSRMLPCSTTLYYGENTSSAIGCIAMYLMLPESNHRPAIPSEFPALAFVA
jgi:hypothetical protein